MAGLETNARLQSAPPHVKMVALAQAPTLVNVTSWNGLVTLVPSPSALLPVQTTVSALLPTPVSVTRWNGQATPAWNPSVSEHVQMVDLVLSLALALALMSGLETLARPPFV